jgi:hypothetical protein
MQDGSGNFGEYGGGEYSGDYGGGLYKFANPVHP